MQQFVQDKDVMGFVIRRKYDVAFMIAGVFLGIWFNWTTVEILIFLVFLWSILGPIASRFLALPALFFLVTVPVLLTLKRDERAEEFAVYAYYFLVMAVIRAIIEVRNEGKEE